jgi:hypothetical protein
MTDYGITIQETNFSMKIAHLARHSHIAMIFAQSYPLGRLLKTSVDI